jgi:hypothetical protein
MSILDAQKKCVIKDKDKNSGIEPIRNKEERRTRDKTKINNN